MDAISFAGLNPNQLAERMSQRGDRVYASVVGSWLKGSMPGGEYMLRLPGALGVDGHWLLTGEGTMERRPTSEAEALVAHFRELLARPTPVTPPSRFKPEPLDEGEENEV